jgi:thioredoxin reductase (NADPH)
MPLVLFFYSSFRLHPSSLSFQGVFVMADVCMRHFDVVIIGGGATGLTAGLYAARGRMNALLIEGRAPGGQLLNADVIENYPGFPDGIMATDLVELIERQARRHGLEIERGEVEIIQPRDNDFLIQTTIGDICTRAVIVCTGGQHKHLGVPGERELAGRGVSYCATCDGPLYRTKDIMVVGGGNTAVDEAIFLSKFAAKLYIVHRRDQLRAEKILQERLFSLPNVEYFWSSVVTALQGTSMVEAAVIKDLKSGESRTVPVGAVFIAIGMQPSAGFLPEAVARDEAGFIITDRHMRTSVPGLYAAGDVVSGSSRQITTGVGEATAAILSVQQHLMGN